MPTYWNVGLSCMANHFTSDLVKVQNNPSKFGLILQYIPDNFGIKLKELLKAFILEVTNGQANPGNPGKTRESYQFIF